MLQTIDLAFGRLVERRIPRRRPRVRLANGVAVALDLGDIRLLQRRAAGDVILSVSMVNLGRNLLGRFDEVLERLDTTADRFEVVVSERALTRAGREALLSLSGLRDRGAGVALSGFGARSSNLALLRKLPLTALLLDPTLVRGLPFDRDDAALIDGLSGLTRSLQVTLVATGVETEAQRTALIDCGVECGQGPLFESLRNREIVAQA